MTEEERFLLELLDEMPRDRAWELVSEVLDQLGGIPWLKEMDAKYPELLADAPPAWRALIKR